jgi:Flp pilus assembly protein TadB
MILTRIALIALAAALLVTSYFTMRYYRDTSREMPRWMRRFLYISIISSLILIVFAGFQFLFALGVAMILTPTLMWYMQGGEPIKKIGALYSKLPETLKLPSGLSSGGGY